MRTLALVLTSIIVIAAEEPAYQLARQGNLLIVTAPSGQSGVPQGVLAQRLTVDLVAADIDEVAAFLQRTTALNVVVTPDLRARGAAVTLAAQDMTVGNVLTWMATVGDFHQGFIDGALCLSLTPPAGPSATRFYDVSDLVLAVQDFPGPELSIPTGDGMQLSQVPDEARPTTTVDELVALIERHVHPSR